MPYKSVDELPDNIKKLAAKDQRRWMQVWNSAYARCSSGGKDAKSCESSAFAQANGVVLGGESKNSATFAVEAPLETFQFGQASAPLFEDGEMTYRTGMLFRAGDYPDKSYAMTAAELAAAAEAFSDPLPLDLEHVPTPLDGKLGELVSVETRGDELHGIVALPKWLDAALDERKVSATWDRNTKTLAGLALVRNPRVTDAALMAAFAVDEVLHDESALETLAAWFAGTRHDTPEGQQIMQDLHNTSARGGAVCKSTNTAKMASGHESSTIQKVHDLTTEHGAACSSKKPGQPGWPYMFSRKEGSSMTTAWDWLKSKLEGEPSPETTAPGGAAATMSVAETPEFKAMKAEQDALKAENQRIRLERIQDQAAAFADEQIHAKKAFPAERDALVADFVQRASDDLVLEPATVSFKDAEGKDQTRKLSRVDMLRADFVARPAHALDIERLKPDELAVLSNRSETETKDKPADDKRVKQLAEMTPLGRATFAEKNGK
jgi:cation transport regulator ChaB